MLRVTIDGGVRLERPHPTRMPESLMNLQLVFGIGGTVTGFLPDHASWR